MEDQSALNSYLQNMPKLLITMRGALAVSDFGLFIKVNQQIKKLATQIDFQDLRLTCERFEEHGDHCPRERYSAHVRDCVAQFYNSLSGIKEK